MLSIRKLGNPYVSILSTKKLSTYPRKSTERYANKNGSLGGRKAAEAFRGPDLR
jgi:hypothetical protein